MKKILMMCEYFPDEEKDISGGVEKRAFEFVQRTQDQFEYIILTSRTKQSQKKKTKKDHKTIYRSHYVNSYTSDPNVLQRLIFLFWLFFKGFGILSKEKNIVVSAENFTTYLPALVLGRLFGKKTIITYHETWIGMWIVHKGIAGILGEIYERLILFMQPQIIAVSSFTKKTLVDKGFKQRNITVIPNGTNMPTKKFKGPSTSRKIKRLISISRLSLTKRVDLVLHALTNIPQVQLDVYGTGPESERLQALAKELGLEDRVFFRGWISGEDKIFNKIAEFDGFVSASQVEGFGITVVQAMAVNCPCVVSNIAPYKEITQGAKGVYVFTQGDVKDLTKKLKQCLSSSARPEKPTKYDLATIAKQYASFLEKMCKH